MLNLLGTLRRRCVHVRVTESLIHRLLFPLNRSGSKSDDATGTSGGRLLFSYPNQTR